MLMQDKMKALGREGVHHQSAKARWTCKIPEALRPVKVVMNESHVRICRHFPSDRIRPRHAFGDDFSCNARGRVSLGLAEPSTPANAKSMLGERPWGWEYMGRYFSNAASDWLPEQEVREIFT